MAIKIFSIGPLETNCYVIYNDEPTASDKAALVVDPGGDPSPVIEFLKNKNLELAGIYITHLHFDHLYGVADLHAATNAPVFAPADDAFLLDTESGKGGMWGFAPVKKFDFEALTEGDHNVKGLQFQALHTPGHTPGSMSLYFPNFNLLCSGDVLFYRSIGRSDLPGGHHQTLISSIKTKLLSLPLQTAVYPGHGPQSSVGDEKANNPFCGDFSR